MLLHCPASEVTGLKSQNWHSYPHFGAAAMDVPLQCQHFRYFSLSYSGYATTKACCVEGGSTSCCCRAVCWLQCSHYGLLSSSVPLLKPASQIAPGVRERRALAAWNWHSQCPHVAEVTKKSSGERKTLCSVLLCSTAEAGMMTEARLTKSNLWKRFQKIQSWWWDETWVSLYEWLICGSAADYKGNFTLSRLFFWLLLHHILFQIMHCK